MSEENQVTRVEQICIAYESGFGHGGQQDNKVNPYDPETHPECHEAYSIGYREGRATSTLHSICADDAAHTHL